MTPDATRSPSEGPDADVDGDVADEKRAARRLAALVEEAHLLIDGRQVQSLFQPIVHLESAEVVGYEALTRGPAGSRLESPLQLLEAGRLAGRLAELDWMCATAACDAAIAADLHPSMTVFLNFEPETLLAPCPDDLHGPARRALDHLRVMIETEEDTLSADPSTLFEALGLVHDVGWGVAIDNAEASTAALALLPLVRPDVLKLDLRRLRDDPSTAASMIDGARSYAERTGATILAQKIEHHDDVRLAVLAGATYGQGHLFGLPAPLPGQRVVPRSVIPLLAKASFSKLETPFEVVTGSRATAVTERWLLEELSRYLEEQVDAHGHPALLLVNFPAGADEATARERYLQLARRAAFTVTFGLGSKDDTNPEARLRAATVEAGDPVAGEWDTIVLGPHYAVALVARDLGDLGAKPQRRLEYAITYDRGLVLQAALSFLSRVGTATPPLVA